MSYNKALNRKIYIICGGFLGVFCVFILGVSINKLNYEKRLLSQGIRTEAQVINKSQLKTRKGKIKKSSLDLAIFEDTTTIVKHNQIETVEAPQNLSDKIDNLFNKIGAKNIAIGDYKTVNVLVSMERFGATKVGDHKTFVYIKNELDKGMLLDAL